LTVKVWHLPSHQFGESTRLDNEHIQAPRHQPDLTQVNSFCRLPAICCLFDKQGKMNWPQSQPSVALPQKLQSYSAVSAEKKGSAKRTRSECIHNIPYLLKAEASTFYLDLYMQSIKLQYRISPQPLGPSLSQGNKTMYSARKPQHLVL